MTDNETREDAEYAEADNQFRARGSLLNAINRVFWEALTCESEADVARVCLAVAEELTESKYGFLGEVNQQGRLDTIALSDPGWDACRVPDTQAVAMIRNMEVRGVWSKPILYEKSVIVNDPASDPNHVSLPNGHPPVTCFLGVPLKQAGKTVGLIALANREGGYDESNRGDIEALVVAFVEALYRKRAEQERDRILTLSPDLICVTGINGYFKYLNPAWENTLGYTIDEMLARPFLDFIHPEDHKRTADELASLSIGSEAIGFENRYICKDGSIRAISWRVTYLPETHTMYCIGRDITESKKAREYLQRSEERFRQVAASAGEWIWEVDANGLYTYASPVAEQMLGYKPEEIVGQLHFYDMWVPDLKEELKKAALDVFSRKEAFSHFINASVRKNGAIVILETSGLPIIDSNGTLLGYRGADTDITERKKAEEQLKQTAQENEVLLKEIHHRIKNNMQVISSLLNLQATYFNGNENTQLSEMLKDTQNRVTSMALVHEQLYQSEDLGGVDFDKHVRSLMSYLFRSYGVFSGNVALKTDIQDTPLALGVAIPCGLIVSELTSNALKHGFPDGSEGEIRIGFAFNGGQYKLVVSNNGKAFPDHLDFRASGTMGLHVVITLARQLEGTVDLERQGGTTFTIIFPK